MWEKDKSEIASLRLNIKKKELRSWHLAPLLNGKYKGKWWKQRQMSSFWAPKSLWMVTAAIKKKVIASLQESNDKPRQCVEKQRLLCQQRSV